MARSLEDIIEVKRAAEARLLAIPGVHGVAVGLREVDGRLTEEIVISVSVLQKKPLGELPPEEVIPSEIDGVPTDVIEHSLMEPQADDAKYRPIKGGAQIQLRRGPFLPFLTGTMGCIVSIDKTDVAALLTNHHVVADAHDDLVAQPSRESNCCACCPAIIGTRGLKILSEDLDGAICVIDSAVQWNPSIIDIGGVTGTASAVLNETVRKRGRTTGTTSGTVTAIDYSGTRSDGWEFKRQVRIKPPSNREPFSRGGDSGSAVVNQKRQVVALLWGGTTDYAGASPIEYAIKQLGIKVVIAPSAAVPAEEDRANRAVLAEAVARELGTSAKGRELLEIYERHGAEILDLVKGEWHVTAVWHRSHGPDIVRSLLAAAAEPHCSLPLDLGERSFGACAEDVIAALMAYGSDALRLALVRLGLQPSRFAGMTYAMILEELNAISREEALVLAR